MCGLMQGHHTFGLEVIVEQEAAPATMSVMMLRWPAVMWRVAGALPAAVRARGLVPTNLRHAANFGSCASYRRMADGGPLISTN